MTEATIFDQQPQAIGQADAPNMNVVPTELVELVGVGKKYATTEDALKSVPHAQKHISTLEAELATAKEELLKRKTAAELLDEMKSGNQTENTTRAPEINPDTIGAIVDQQLKQKETKKMQQTNIDNVIAAFNAKFGEKGPEMYKQLAAESDLSLSYLNNLAATSPNAVLKLAGLTASKNQSVGHIESNVNTEAFNRQTNANDLSARVPKGAKTTDMLNAWSIAGQKAKLKQQG